MAGAIQMPRWITYVGVFMIFITIMVTSYQLKTNVNKANVTNENYLATLVQKNPLYNGNSFHEVVLDNEMTDTQLVEYGQKEYADYKRPEVFRLSQPASLQSFDEKDQPGQVTEIDFYISEKNQELWYKMTYPLQAIFKENLSEVFDLDTDIQVDLKNLVVYAKVKVLNGATPEKFMSYLPTLHEQILNNVENNQEIKQVKIELVTNEDRYVYDRQNQNQLIHIKTLKNEEKNGKD